MTDHYEAAHAAAIQHQRECDPRGVPDGRPWLTCMGDPCRGRARADGFTGLRTTYAWAIPNQAALDTIARHSPRGVVEIGAGGGYWAKLLREAGLDVIAYDIDPDGHLGWHHAPHGGWSHVNHGTNDAAARHPDRTLLLCWPDSPIWATNAVDKYHAAGGHTVIYIGQRADRPEQLRDPAETVAIPQWADVDDRLERYPI